MLTPPKKPPKILQTKREICEAFQWGEDRFRKWLNRGIPVKKIDGRYVGHRDSIEIFIQTFIDSSEC